MIQTGKMTTQSNEVVRKFWTGTNLNPIKFHFNHVYFLHFYSRYSLIEEFTEPPPVQTTTASVVSQTSQTSNQTTSTTSTTTSSSQNTVQSNTIPTSVFNVSSNKPASRKGGIIFPSVKNKPSVGNSTFTTDILSFKDVKVSQTAIIIISSSSLYFRHYFLLFFSILLIRSSAHIYSWMFMGI